MLQEILTAARPRCGHVPLVVADCTEQFECGLEVVPDLANGGKIATAIAVVGGTPDSHDILVGKMVFISLVDQLMRSSDQGKVVNMAELIRHAISEKPS